MHIARVGERLPRLQIQFRISRSFRTRNLANLGSKIRFWIRRKEHTLPVTDRNKQLFKAWFSYAADAPVTWPLVLPGILFRYENGSGRQHWSSQSLSPACLRS